MTNYTNGQRLRVTRTCCGAVLVGDIVTVTGTRTTTSERNGTNHSWEILHWNSGEYLVPVETPEAAPVADYEVGTELRLLTNPKCLAASQREGDTPNGEVFFDASVTRVRVERKLANGNYSVRRLDGTGWETQLIHSSSLAPLVTSTTEAATPILDASLGIRPATSAREDDLALQITALRTELEAARDQARIARDRHERDIELIGTTMMEAAEENDMCNVYDENVETLNCNLHISLPVRKKSYRVRIEFVQYIDVDAEDEDSALEEAQQADEYGDSNYLEETDTDVEEN